MIKTIEQRCREYMANASNPWRLKTRGSLTSREASFIFNAFGKMSHILDAGGGTGFHIHEALKGHDSDIVVFDQDQNLLDHGKEQYPHSTFVQGSCLKLPFEKDSFEGVLIRANLLYFSDKIAYLKEVARVLKPGGVVVIIDRNKFDLTTTVARVIGAKQDPFELPDDFMTFTQLRSFLGQSGFSVSEELGLMITIPKPGAVKSLFTSERVPSRVIQRFATGGFYKSFTRWMLVRAIVSKEQRS